MITGIDVLVQDGSGRRRSLNIGFMHVLGGVAGGVVAGSLIWLLFAFVRTILPTIATVGMLIAVPLAAIAIDARWLPPMPTRGQVPQSWWVRYGAERGYFLYGAVLGSVVFTFIPYGVAYTVLFAAAMYPTIGLAMAVGAAVGLGRTTLVAGRAVVRATSRDLTQSLNVGYRMAPKLSGALSAAYLIVLLAAGPMP